MSEMVERIARVLRVARGCEAPSVMEDDTVPCPFCHYGPDEDGKPHDETGCFWWANKVIAEMREPTVPMVESSSPFVEGDTAVEYTQNTYEVWRNMIDAALK